MRRSLKLAVSMAFILAAQPSISKSECNKNNNLTFYVEEWLSHSAEHRRIAEDFLRRQQEKMGDESAAFVSSYNHYYGSRAAPLNEIKLCGMLETIQIVDVSLRKIKG